ncbi:MAG: HypC/HybG/HupF family hydrogenase formation chaperone [Pirellulales bacterium]
MCLAIPAQIADVAGDEQASGTVDIMGVRRKVNLQLLADDPPAVGDWVLVHVGFAMSRISEQQAAEQLEILRQMGEAGAAHEEASGYSTESALPGS